MGRRRVIVRVNKDREDALAMLKFLFALKSDAEVYDLALSQLYEAACTLEQRLKKEKANEVVG
jgi:hypothetical protein